MEQHFDEATARDREDRRRESYSEEAIFSRVGRFTLVHLDSPSPEEIARRVAEFDPDKFFFDDCPLCTMAREEGGDIVFDGTDESDPLRASSYGVDVSDPAEVALSPAASFDLALINLGGEAEEFGGALHELVSEQLEARYTVDVDQLHDRMIEILWSEESTRRVELFEEQIARAHATVEAICAAAPPLAAVSTPLRDALDALAAVWRRL